MEHTVPRFCMLNFKGLEGLRPQEIIHGKGFTWRDPIESTEVFQKAYDEVKEQVLLESKALREKNMKVDNDELFKKAMKQRGISWKPPVKMEEKKSLFKRK